MGEKKILLIGELNSTTRDIIECLEEYFQVQLCGIAVDDVKRMLDFLKPHLIVINLIGGREELDELFTFLSAASVPTGVITVGNKEEYMPYEQFYQKKQFENVERPVKRWDILMKCCVQMGMDVGALKKKEATALPFGNFQAVSPSGSRNILVVDDSKVLLRNVKQWLDEKYDVRLASSAKQAWMQIGKVRPDMILLDYDMPECNGKEFFEQLREDPELTDIPVVFLTGVDKKDQIIEVLKILPAKYLLKPVAYNTLMEVCEEILGNAQK